MDPKLIRKLAEKAKELMVGMRWRVHRDPDYADFEAGFRLVVEKYEKDKLMQIDIGEHGTHGAN